MCRKTLWWKKNQWFKFFSQVKVIKYRLWSENYPSAGHFSLPFLCKVNWTSLRVNLNQRLLNLKVKSGGFVWAGRKHTSQITTFWVDKAPRAATNWDCKKICRYDTLTHLFSSFSSFQSVVFGLVTCFGLSCCHQSLSLLGGWCAVMPN